MGALEERLKVAKPTTMLLFGALLAVGYWQAMYDDGAGIEQQTQTLKTEANKIEADLNQTRAALKNREKFQAELVTVTEQYKGALELLPPDFNTQDLLKKIAKEARFSGVNLVSVRPGEPANRGFYEEIRIDVEMEGSFGEVAGFISNMSKLNRIVNVQNIEMKMKDIFETLAYLQFKGTLVSYRYTGGG